MKHYLSLIFLIFAVVVNARYEETYKLSCDKPSGLYFFKVYMGTKLEAK